MCNYLIYYQTLLVPRLNRYTLGFIQMLVTQIKLKYIYRNSILRD